MAHLSSDFDEKSLSEPRIVDAAHPANLMAQTTWNSGETRTAGSSESSRTNTVVGLDSPTSSVRTSLSRTIRKFCGSPPSRLADNESPQSPEQIASEIAEDRFQPEHRPRLELYPKGYPRFAAFQASDEAFSIYRRFDYLHARVLLDLQYEISLLEKQLLMVDEDDDQDECGQRRLASRLIEDRNRRNGDSNSCKRRDIMIQLRNLLSEYDGLVIKAKGMVALQKPNLRDYISVTKTFNNWKPLVRPEWYSLQQQDDMVTLRQGREWAMFDGWIETVLRKCDSWCPLVERIFRPERLRGLSGDESIHYYDPRRVEGLVAIVITAIIFVLLVIPVVLMYNLTSLGNRNSTFDAIGVLVVFTLVFSAAMSLLTKAKRHELFGASAAYCAVLVVFITNFNGSSPGSP